MLFKWFYRVLSSLKTSIWIMGLMIICYFVGTIFPQGAEYSKYKEAGGRYLWFVKTFGALNIFVSPLFIGLTLLLCINLLVCILNRLINFRKRTELLSDSTLKTMKGLIPLPETMSLDQIQQRLLKKGFKLIDINKDQYIYGKGLPYWWLSWIYHLGMILAIGGFFITALCAYEDEVTLWQDREVVFYAHSPDTRWNRLLKRLGVEVPEKPADKEYRIRLKEFQTEYYEVLDFEYPGDALSRVALGLGFSSITPSEQTGLSPKLWRSVFEIQTPEGKTHKGEVMVNVPFRIDSLVLYQMGYLQKVLLEVDGKEMEVEAYEPFSIDTIKAQLRIMGVKHGTVYNKQGQQSPLKPRITIYKGKQKIATLQKDQEVEIQGIRIKFKDFKEASILSYRIDPGVPIIGLATLLVFVGLSLRVYGNFYRVRVIQQRNQLYISISTRGLLADRQKVLITLGLK